MVFSLIFCIFGQKFSDEKILLRFSNSPTFCGGGYGEEAIAAPPPLPRRSLVVPFLFSGQSGIEEVGKTLLSFPFRFSLSLLQSFRLVFHYFLLFSFFLF